METHSRGGTVKREPKYYERGTTLVLKGGLTTTHGSSLSDHPEKVISTLLQPYYCSDKFTASSFPLVVCLSVWFLFWSPENTETNTLHGVVDFPVLDCTGCRDLVMYFNVFILEYF